MDIQFAMNKGKQKLSTYSQLGKNLLSQCIEKHGYTILYDCGVSTTTLKRMVKKGLTGREMDLIISLLALEETSSVYITKREYELLGKVFGPALELFSWKIMMLLSLRIFHSQINHSFYLNNTYEKAFFETAQRSERYYLDRRYIFDPIMYFICELYKAQSRLTDDGLENLFNTNLAEDNNKLALLASRLPRKTKKTRLQVKVIGTRRDITGPTIRKEILKLYSQIKETFSANSIDNIQKNCISKTGKYIYEIKKLRYNNFALHRDKGTGTQIPNLALAEYRRACVRLSPRK